MKLGIIGTGNMGTILVQSLIESTALPPADLVITNRTLTKANKLKSDYPDLTVVQTANEAAKLADIVFVCIKPLDIQPLLEQLRGVLKPHQLLVSITSPVRVDQVESIVDCHVARVIPSITNRSLSGSTLITFGESCGDYQKELLTELVSYMSKPVLIDEAVTRVASDISSCGPAFLCFLFEHFIDAAVKETGISKEQATLLTSEMVVGLGKLLEKDIYSLESLQEKVTVKGGVTGVGLDVLENEIGDMFEQLFRQTQNKFAEDHEAVDKQFDYHKKI
ncbi:competence protein ComER [Scopulibacillus darangshiensis]|uniref:Pyrroline-5-carboxylate reductase n=1 Tax=Scopulibacillus darangshiensis TaxID=442528 RepID=A0A4R2PDY0_9BACL|nr:late competence protein ComER [Scopulibacillus darangshiensis]TCP32321.1 competence protein ComER [Scopulibacillus darangshiensis]